MIVLLKHIRDEVNWMKLFAIIIPSNLHWAPYCLVYQKLLVENNCKYDLIIWNREKIEEEIEYKEGLNQLIGFDCYDICNDGSIKKIPKFFQFSDFVKKQLTKTHYDGVFMLTTFAGVVALNAHFLSKRYNKKYWIDIRDYTYEWFKPYYKLLEYAIDNAYTVSISSREYTKFLPDNDYVIVHNIDPNLEKYSLELEYFPSDYIRISYIGNIAYIDENKKLLDKLKNDSRFRLQYYGANSELLKSYCEFNRILNVDFHDKFSYAKTGAFYENTDIVNNVYGNDTIGKKTAISNKLYYAAALNKAIITSPDTYICRLTNEYGFGFSVDFSDNDWPDRLYDWYQRFRENKDLNNSKQLWESCLRENEIFYSRINEFINR